MGRTHTETERAELCEITEGETVSVRYSSNRSTSMVEREGVVESVSESSSGVITVRTEGFRLRFLPASGSTVVESLPARNRLDNGETVVVERVVEVVDEDGDGVSVEEAFELLAPEEDDEDDVEEESNSHAARIEAQLRMGEEDDEVDVEDDEEEDPVAEVLERDDDLGTLPDFEEFRSGGDGEPVTDGGRDVEYDAIEHFAAYVGGLVELDTVAAEDGSAAVVRASESALRDARGRLEERGYETTLVDVDPADSGLIVSPSDRDIRAVLDAIEEGVPEPGESLDVDDPIDRDGEPITDGGIIVAGDGGEVLDDSADRKAQGDRESRSAMSDYRERITAREADVIDGLSEGSLTEMQAVAFALREVFGRTREETAEVMGLSTSSVDTHRRRGAAKVEEARSTVAALVDDSEEDRELVTDGGRDVETIVERCSASLRERARAGYGEDELDTIAESYRDEIRAHEDTGVLDEDEVERALDRVDEALDDALDRDEPVTDGGRDEPRRSPVAESRSKLVDSIADRVYDSIEFGDVDRQEGLSALAEVAKEVESGTPSLKRFEDLEAGEEL